MGKTLELGRRIELQPMDKCCHDISLGLYRRVEDGVPQFLVHTYSADGSAPERVAFLTRALTVMLSMEEATKSSEPEGVWLRFSCKSIHERALKRAFLDLCKLESNAPLELKPLIAFDKKANGHLTAVSLGGGLYQMKSVEETDAGLRRAAALARGFAKLCEMDSIEGEKNQVLFSCKTSHDAIMGTLMFRAQNVRAMMQEEEMTVSRGVLAAPSQQE